MKKVQFDQVEITAESRDSRTLEIPEGMSGAALKRWIKRERKASLRAAKRVYKAFSKEISKSSRFQNEDDQAQLAALQQDIQYYESKLNS